MRKYEFPSGREQRDSSFLYYCHIISQAECMSSSQPSGRINTIQVQNTPMLGKTRSWRSWKCCKPLKGFNDVFSVQPYNSPYYTAGLALTVLCLVLHKYFMRTVPGGVSQTLTLQRCHWGHLQPVPVPLVILLSQWQKSQWIGAQAQWEIPLSQHWHFPRLWGMFLFPYNLQGPGSTGDLPDLKSFPEVILEAVWTSVMDLQDRQRILWLPWKLRPESRLCVREEAGAGQVKTRVVTSPGLSLDTYSR